MLDPTIIQSLGFACQQLKARVQQALEPSAQLSLPAEVVALLKLPQRNDTGLLKELFNCIVGTSKETLFTNAIYTLLQKNNASSQPLPGQPQPAGASFVDLLRIKLQVAKEKKGKGKSSLQSTKQESSKRPKKNQSANPDQDDDESAAIADDAAAAEDDQEIYENYRAARINGRPHPDAIVETSSLASIRPPKPTYEHHLQDMQQSGTLSDAQLETIVYANMRFQTSIEGGAAAGFFLGDGAGVGKGRQIAGLILEHKLTGGKRCLWISVSNDLRYDAQRDLKDVNAKNIQVWPEGNATLPKGRIDKHFRQGVLFVTYSLLVSNAKSMGDENADGSSNAPIDMAIPAGSRLAQIVDWLKGDEEPLIILDECHKAKNLVAPGGKSTQTGKAILKLQLNLPKAKVLYSSATGASEPNNLAYMIRLGTCGFKTMTDLVKELNRSGLGTLEMFSMGLKATGCYVSRALSYKGAEFLIAKVKMDPEFKIMYNRSCDFWHLLFTIIRTMPKPGRKTMGQFFSSQQRFYRQMLMAAKVPDTAKLALEAVAEGMCVVIGLQSTGEANTSQVREASGDVMDDFVSAPQQVLLHFLERHFPTYQADMSDREISNLHAQVYMAVDKWKQLLPAREQMRRDSYQAANPEARQPVQAVGTEPATGPVAAGDDNSDDEIILGETLTLDQVIERQREEQKRTGCYIDLTAIDSDDDELKQAHAAIRREAAEEDAQKKKAAADKTKNEEEKLLSEVREAEEDVEEARRELLVAQEALQDSECAAEPPARKRLQRNTKAAVSCGPEEPRESESLATRKRPPGRTLVISDGEDDSSDVRVVQANPRRQPSASVIVLDSSSDEDDNQVVTSPNRSRQSAKKQRLSSEPSGCSGDVPQDKGGSPGGVAPDQAMGTTDPADDTSCIVCGSTDNAAEMLLCDGCDTAGAHHLGCLQPPLDGLPQGEWFCPDCLEDKKNQQEADAEMKARGKTGLTSDDSADDSEPMARRPAIQEFTGGKTANKRGLLLKEKAAARKLEKAEERLRAVEQSSGRARRALSRRSAQPASRPGRAPVSGSDSEAGGADIADSDSDFSVADDAEPAHRRRAPAKDVKPKIAKPAEYRHAIAREALTDAWEQDVDAMADRPGEVQEQHGLVKIKNMLIRLVQALELPANPLDQLTELCGGCSEVSEMTGRKGQLVRDDEDGLVKYQNRRAEESQKMVNMREKYAFMEGEKLIAIISEAASTGISLQADKRCTNQRRRCHLTLELPWSADKAIQQFGRSHRSNQASAPIYRIIVTECAGEFRFAASAAKRLQSLGALLKGDRRALGAGQDLKEFDCDHKLGLTALKRIFDDIIGRSSAMPDVKVPEVPHHARTEMGVDYSHPLEFYRYLQPKMVQVGMLQPTSRHGTYKEDTKVSTKVSTWLNRVLAMGLEDQDLLFSYFSATLDAVIRLAQSKGEYDQGIMSLKASSVTVEKQEAIHSDKNSDAKTYHTTLRLDRGCLWESALQDRNAYIEGCRKKNIPPSAKTGFYIDKKKHGKDGYPYILLATELTKVSKQSLRRFRIQRPNIGASKELYEGELTDYYRRVQDNVAERTWQYWFELTGRGCLHGPSCHRKKRKETCTWGQRMQRMHLISGAVLPVLKQLYQVVENSGYGRNREGKKTAPRVFRAKLDSGDVIVGMELNSGDTRLLVEKLETGDVAGPDIGFGDYEPESAWHDNL